MSKSPKELAVDILARRDHSTYEIRAKLKKKIFDPTLIDETISWLIEKRLLNDADFAQKKAESIMRTKLVGPMYVKNKLREARIAGDIIDDVVEHVADSGEWQGRAKKAVIQWQKIHPKHKDDTVRQARFLASRGFDPAERLTY